MPCHALITGERNRYYADFGSLEHLARGYRDGYVYQGQNSQFRRRPHGAPVADIPAERFVVYSQTVLQPRSCLVLYRVEESGVA